MHCFSEREYEIPGVSFNFLKSLLMSEMSVFSDQINREKDKDVSWLNGRSF